MKPFSELSAEELAMENLFIRWVRFPDDPPIRSFWENWILKYPAQKDTVAKARELVLIASDWKPDSLSSQDVNSIWGRIMNSLDIMGDRDSRKAPHDGPANGMSAGNILLILTSVTFLLFIFYVILGNS
ncbi:hypothetical protein [Dyadobacter fermentans]|uniref:Uncharacterized protein n=1 Tax=Dyadobacter fermentans (strain ATCC 700827 / DSM 18053 / CIP 107007 / KCTC 52180 / NS114) TaxID=471854 RepID=C6VWW1_DYAFD|nr:hypothetical protein [Dyadobacter fermentans]ACT96861.1 hypothetical protein Dfer_5671 [Dyadobacter fermentans DSM 18053]